MTVTRARQSATGDENSPARRSWPRPSMTPEAPAFSLAKRRSPSPFALPKALVEAAKRESGIDSPTDLGILALATLARPDPVAAFLKRTHGRLGASHTLEL